jgi:hypothetical protein
VSTAPADSPAATDSSEARLDNWLVELDQLMQAEAWDAAHAQIQAMQRQIVVQEQAGRF